MGRIMTVQQFAQAEYRSAPLVDVMNCRLPKRLAVFLKTSALVDGVSEAVVMRYALTQWAIQQGYDPNGC